MSLRTIVRLRFQWRSWIARNRLLDTAMVGFDGAMHERLVNFADAASGELLGQIAMRGVGFGDQDHSAGVAIQAMHNAGAQLATLSGERTDTLQSSCCQPRCSLNGRRISR